MEIKRLIAVACAVAGACFTMTGVAAARECKSETVTAEGDVATLRDLGAYPNSLFAWRKTVKEKFGGEWNSWRYAQEAKVDCQQITSGGKTGWKCTRTAKPCQDTLSTVVGEAKEQLNAKDCKSEALSSYGSKKSTEDAAIEELKSGWRIDTSNKYGAEWAHWSKADDADSDCRKVGSGYQCIAIATPCKAK